MNRLQPLLPERPIEHHAESPTTASSALYTPSVGRSLCAVFAPLHYEPNYAYPLLVWLHGPGDDESQLKRIMPLVSMRNYVAVAPRGTREVKTAAGRPAFAWRQSEPDIVMAEQRIFESLALAGRRFRLHDERVFLAGFDCGGTMAYRVALRHPGRFAGILSLGGRFPTGQAPLNRLEEVRRIPLFVASCRDSAAYPPDQVCADLRLFHSAGMQVCLRQYPCGQELTTTMLSDLDRWIMDEIGGTA